MNNQRIFVTIKITILYSQLQYFFKQEIKKLFSKSY
jgi:hypothetical protein